MATGSEVKLMKEERSMRLMFVIITLVNAGCGNDGQTNPPVSESSRLQFGQPQKVTVSGYGGDIMEPFLSRDGSTLFFNNLNDPSVNTNLHFADRINDSAFQYRGEVRGVNTGASEGVPSLDSTNTLYFVSTRNYDQTFSTIYTGRFGGDSVSNVQLVSGISRQQFGWANFDVEVSKDGNFLYFVDGRYDQNGGPYEADIVLAEKKNGIFQRSSNQAFLENINSDALEYAACVSSNMLELYFTRVGALSPAISGIYVATKNSVDQPFNQPYKIDTISGFVEAPTISPDDRIIYYHKKENGKFVLYMVRKAR